MNLESGVLQVHIEDIIPNRFQPRLTFDEQGLKELSDSIKEHGIIQPLVLRKLGDKYEIIAGERRYKASQMAGLTTVPAVIANIDDNKSAEVALVENVQRRDLTAIEEARSYKNLLDKGYLTQDQLAKRMGLSQSAISNKLRLLNLDEEVQEALLEEKISERHARTLLSLADKNAQREWLHRVINERLTVRQLDMELKKMQVPQTNIDDLNGEVPLVSQQPSIEDIKANAMDIGMANKMQQQAPSVETLEVLEEPQTSPFATVNPNEPVNNNSFTTATTVPEFNIATPNSASTFIPPSNMVAPEQDNNRFFNVSNEPAPAAPTEPLFKPLNPNVQNNNGIEVFDDPTAPDVAPAPIQQTQVTQPQNKGVLATGKSEFINDIPPQFESNPNNKFFTNLSDPKPSTANFVNNITNQQAEFNPMAAVKNLEKEEGIKTEEEVMELKDAIASIRTQIEGLGSKGFVIDVEEIDFDHMYQITMKIHKDN